MKRIFSIILTVAAMLVILSGCRGTEPSQSDNVKSIALTVAETLPSCVAFEYDEAGSPYCFYGYDTEGHSYRVLWTDFRGLNEKDQIIVEYDEDIKTLSYDEYPSGWTPKYEVTAIKVKMEKRANENLVSHIGILSGDKEIYPFGCLLWSRIDNEDGTFTESIVDKYDVVDLVSGKTSFPVTDIPTLVLDERVGYFVQVNGRVEKVYLIAPDGSEYTKSETTFKELSNLADGTYYVVVEVLLSGNCDPDAPQNSYRYEDVFRLVVGADFEEQTESSDTLTNVVEELKFSEYLDDIKFVPGLSQANFISLIEQYSYKNEKVTDLVTGMNYDGISGGGWQGTDERFGFYNDYTVTEDNKYANYSNRLYTTVQLDGLKLPYEINFDDSLDDVFSKIGIKVNLYSDFVPDKKSDTDMTLYCKGDVSLAFRDLNCTKEPVDYELPYILVFTEKYSIEQKNGKLTSVERMVKLYFSDGNTGENNVLGCVEISVIETRMLE